MNWITNFVLPKIQSLSEKNDIPDHLWDQCPHCNQMIFHREQETNDYVCPHCQGHMRLPLQKRIDLFMNPGNYQRIKIPPVKKADPLSFKDSKKYTDRLKDYRSKTQENDAIAVVKGMMGPRQVILAVMNFAFMGGSMGSAVGNGLVAAAEESCRYHAPLIVVTASGGARMQEGAMSLMQMPRIVAAIQKVKKARIPYIVVLTDPTTGGVSASFAMLGDITLAEPGAMIGFAGANVIQETIREALPEGFQRAEYLLEHGMIDGVVHRSELKATLIKILGHIDRTPSAKRRA